MNAIVRDGLSAERSSLGHGAVILGVLPIEVNFAGLSQSALYYGERGRTEAVWPWSQHPALEVAICFLISAERFRSHLALFLCTHYWTLLFSFPPQDGTNAWWPRLRMLA